MQRNIAETILGGVVLLVAAGFLFFFSRTADISPTSGYVLKANFNKIDGLDVGSPVKISGVKVGQVIDFALDPVHYQAIVRMNIRPDIKLSTDTAAIISSAGLLDGKFLSLVPGNDDEMLSPDDTITQTQAAPSLEELLGKYIFSVSKDKDDKKSDEAP